MTRAMSVFRSRRRAVATALIAWALMACAPSAPAQDLKLTALADLAVMNGRIWTGANGPKAPDPSTEPTSLAIRDGEIIAIGDGKAMLPHLSPATKIINARGRRIIPGITDSHTHFISGGFQLERLNLRDVRSKDEFVNAVAVAAKKKTRGEWLLGGRWSVESWDHPESPTRHWLDPVTGDTPVLLSRMDGHQALANTAALKLAGITVSGPTDPVGGQIERDPKTKEPTGILKESAMEFVRRHIPEPSPSQRSDALTRAMHHANALGITGVHDMSDPADLDVFARADRENTLTVRVTSYPQFNDWVSGIGRLRDRPVNGRLFRVVGMKQYMDGSLGSRTAYMRDPFSDATLDTPYPRGQLTAWASSSAFDSQVGRLVNEGLQPAVHAIGDEANHRLLDVYERATRAEASKTTPRDMRSAGRESARAEARGSGVPNAENTRDRLPYPRVEHAQHLLVEDIPRFAKIGVVASMQPYHKADDGRYAEKAIGRDRLEGSYAFRQLADSGALLIFGSDWPVVTIDPFAGIDAAVNARTLDGKTWLESHSLTVAEALYAYTVAPAKAIGRADELGTLEIGKRADLVVLFDDPFSIPKGHVGDIRVAQTIVDGAIVYNADP